MSKAFSKYFENSIDVVMPTSKWARLLDLNKEQAYQSQKLRKLNKEHHFYALKKLKDLLKLKNYKNEIVDKKRIAKILNNIKKKSLKKKIDPKITNRIWKNMIFAYIDYERRNFKKK